MTGLLPPAQHGVVLPGVKAKPRGRAFGPALTPAAGDIHQHRAGASRRTKIRQFQVSTVRGDCRKTQMPSVAEHPVLPPERTQIAHKPRTVGWTAVPVRC